ncbi:MAG: L,D-transpeptidase family protein [Sphingomicrobium sp.]
MKQLFGIGIGTSLLAIAALGSGAALAAQAQVAPQSLPVSPTPTAPAATGMPLPPLPAPPLPPAMWTQVDAEDLLMAIQQVGREGLNPTDYDPAGLESAIRSGDIALMSAAATQRFNGLSNDLALGHVRRTARTDWHIVDKDLDAARQDSLLRAALAARNVQSALSDLLPTHPQYAALRSALELTPVTETGKADRIRLNMDRWRWLPHDLGAKYIIVNVPGFHATLVENGVNRWKERAIAGSVKTPTPQLTATATGVVLNPWWEVPPSITGEVAGKKGFVKASNGKTWRQPPGSTNALGQVKFVMYNQYNIYLHDTNARSRFNDKTRALSHGCIRTQHIVDLSKELLADGGGKWVPDKVDSTLKSGKSVVASFVQPLPVYIVYFSAAALNDGRIVDYKDIYSRDGKALAALKDRNGGAKPKTAPPAKAIGH